MRLNLFLAMLLVLVFGSMSFAQDCPNGKCPLQSRGPVTIVPKGFAQGPNCQGGNCPLPGKTVVKGAASAGCEGCSGGCSGTAKAKGPVRKVFARLFHRG